MEHAELTTLVIDWVRNHTRAPDADRIVLDDDTDLLARGLLDSLGFVELLEFVQQRMGREVDLSDADPAEFTTVRGFCRLAVSQQARERG